MGGEAREAEPEDGGAATSGAASVDRGSDVRSRW